MARGMNTTIYVYLTFVLLIAFQRPVLDFGLLFATIFLTVTTLSDILGFYDDDTCRSKR
jgi:uncharacterized membrane protein (DUF485 family)